MCGSPSTVIINIAVGGLFLRLESLLSEYLLEIQIKNYSTKTIKGYKGNCGRFIEFMRGEFGVSEHYDVKPQHAKAYIKLLHQKGRSPVYMNTILKNIRSMFQYATDEGYLPRNPFEKVSWLREEKSVLVVPTDIEVAKMLNAFKGSNLMAIRDATMLAMLVDTGVRCAELINLVQTDIIGGSIIINGKGRKQRFVPLSPLMQKQLLKYVRVKELHYKDVPAKSDKLFLSSRGKALTTEAIERVVRRAGYIAGVNEMVRMSPHTLRHYFAIKMLDNGIDIYSLARLLGHSNIRTTQRYVTATTDKQILQRTSNSTPLATLLNRS